MTEWGEVKSNWNEEFTARVDKRTDKSGLEDLEAKKIQEYFNQTFEIIKKINFKIPQPNESLTLITMSSFSSLGIIDYIITQKNNYPIEMVLFLYSINSKIAGRLNEIAEQTEQTKIVISDLQNTAYRTKEKAVLENIKSNKIEKIFAHSHAKIAALKFTDGDYFTITGSGNLANNARVEQYNITNSEKLYDFIYKTYDEIKGIQVKQRNKALWLTTET